MKSSALTSETDSGTASVNSISHDTVDVNKKSVGEAQLKEIGAQKNTAQSGAKYSIKNTSTMTLKEQLNLFYKNALKSSDALYFGMTPKQ